ncbi:MAG: right-handed parallel beta-helix repeat-containing protein [Candidatus Promineofilum sp.]|uniref:right-handed parallel beta-helix repeat-containing protein n=1 Tax=Promineifilum sp. TaxID=2664178 RepID=UPI002411EE0F|nr:right-handed parallel beta-helix repeat-containing protein [Promineifilum sp.]
MQPIQRTLQPHNRRDWLAALMLRHPDRFMPRLSAALARWQKLSRGVRRRFTRRVAATAAGAALALTLIAGPLTSTAHAASISVDNGVVVAADDGQCSLREAIVNANSDSQVFTSTGECEAGSGDDIISLPVDGDFLIEDGPYASIYGTNHGLPLVASVITIEGQGSTIHRDPGNLDTFGILAVEYGELTIHETTISGGAAYIGGGVLAIHSALAIRDSTVSGSFGVYGGGISSIQSATDIVNSTLTDNEANLGGGVFDLIGTVDIVNSTISGNSAQVGGGVLLGFYTSFYTTSTIVNSTITGNHADNVGGGVLILYSASVAFNRSIVSGNTTGNPVGIEVYNALNGQIYSSYTVFGHAGVSNSEAFFGFATSGSDVNATSDGSNDPLSAILDTTLADNGGPTLTHNLVAGSPAVDLAPDADCTVSPVDGVDQRGAARPFDVAGQGNDGSDTCDAGAVEYNSPLPGNSAIFMSTTTAGTTGDGLAFGPEDIIQWDGDAWSTWFDGSAAGLMPFNAKHNLNAIWIPDADAPDFVFSFGQNRRSVPGLADPVDGMDLLWWDGASFSWWFDGSDVGLTQKTQEKIDGLHVLDGSASPINGGNCLAYLLISTQGPAKVPNYSGGQLKFGGEDVVGFCATSLGETTAGLWHMVLDGSAEGMPRNSTDDFSLSEDGQTLYLTTKGTFNVDSATGGHSMVYAYDLGSGTFSGPLFVAADNGLPKKVNGLDVAGDLDE